MPAFLYKPRNSSGQAAVVVIWHGGRKARAGLPLPSRNCWLPSLDRGAAADVRGSSGYGKAYLAADDGPRREQALGDIQATLDWIATHPSWTRRASACTAALWRLHDARDRRSR